MKKLFVACLSAITLFGVAACGTSYDDKVLPIDEAGVTIHAVGQWNDWDPAKNKMEATSVKAVSEFSKELADTLAKKPLKYLYLGDIEIKEVANPTWTVKYVDKDGVLHENVNPGYSLKAVKCTWDADEEQYVKGTHITDPGDNGNCNAEALTDNIYFPPFQRTPDEHGMSWADNPVVTGGVGKYHFVFAGYTTISSADTAGFGFGLVKIA